MHAGWANSGSTGRTLQTFSELCLVSYFPVLVATPSHAELPILIIKLFALFLLFAICYLLWIYFCLNWILLLNTDAWIYVQRPQTFLQWNKLRYPLQAWHPVLAPSLPEAGPHMLCPALMRPLSLYMCNVAIPLLITLLLLICAHEEPHYNFHALPFEALVSRQ